MLDSDVFELKTSQFKVQVAFKDDLMRVSLRALELQDTVRRVQLPT